MTRTLLHTLTLTDGRELVIEIADRGDRITSWFVGREEASLELSAEDAMRLSLGWQHAAVQVGQREANRRGGRKARR